MTLTFSVIVPTHAPHIGRLLRTLQGLREQTLPRDRWELLLIDNASPDPLALAALDLSWHPAARVVREEQLGLTAARLAGFRAAAGDTFVLVDDDNVLDSEYLRVAADLLGANPGLGVLGGKVVPEWEAPPPSWIGEFASCLALRDYGDKEKVFQPRGSPAYPEYAPVGAGMVLRRAVARDYEQAIQKSGGSTDRRGTSLSSGGDNEIVLTALAGGWAVGYFPQLSLAHVIPRTRLTRDYLARLNQGIARSWVQVLARHGIRPWPPVSPWSVPARMVRAYLRCRAWRDAASYVRWKGACGAFQGRAALGRS